MATNRPDTLDPALLRPGRLDRKVEFGLPDLESRTQIFQIHTRTMNCERDIRFELLARLCPNSTGADVRSVCTEAGMFAIRARRKTVTEKDFLDAVNKVSFASWTSNVLCQCLSKPSKTADCCFSFPNCTYLTSPSAALGPVFQRANQIDSCLFHTAYQGLHIFPMPSKISDLACSSFNQNLWHRLTSHIIQIKVWRSQFC